LKYLFYSGDFRAHGRKSKALYWFTHNAPLDVDYLLLEGTTISRKIKSFKTITQWVLMHMPVFGNVIIYNEVTMFTKTFASLLKHNVFITDTMEILNKITNNEIWKMIILDTITNLARGEKISLAFQDHWAVPIPAYEMIVTGERTGQLPEMMQKVSDYYQELHKNAVARIKAFIEPILILFLTGAVGVIVLSIVIPMFDMYQQLG
jgi:type IV pilus assembly protein PilC